MDKKLMKKPLLSDPRVLAVGCCNREKRGQVEGDPPQPPACLLPEAQQGSCSWSGGTGAKQDVGALGGSLAEPGWRAAREAEAFEPASTWWGAPRNPSQVALGWTQTPTQSLRRAAEGVYDKAGCRQSQEAERGAVTQAIRRSGPDLGSGSRHLLVMRSRTAQGTSS